jgi:hypothetical protein
MVVILMAAKRAANALVESKKIDEKPNPISGSS